MSTVPFSPTAEESRSELRVRLVREGIQIGGDLVPMLVGSIHYYGLDPSDWRPALAAVRALGFRLIDTYVPWGVHELASGEFDFGEHDPRRDVAGFLRLAQELGFYAIVRPGPHINAELTFFGIPERVIWDPDCQARSPGDKPVFLPMPPLGFPVPSYASRAFFEQAKKWLEAVAKELGPLCWPNGPIVLYQVDNEAAFYFRDGVYDQDYHRDAIDEYRRFLRSKYESLEALREAVADPGATFETVDPPRRLDASSAPDLGRHLGWAEFQEHMLAQSLARFRRQLEGYGFERLPATHNLPMAETVTPLDPERMSKTIDLLGMDYYYSASAQGLKAIRERTTELVHRSDAREVPAFACEMGAGFPPYFPALTEQDTQFAVMSALAYGLRGFNAYMAVERDRWIGAPIDSHGTARESAQFWKQLCAAIERSQLYTLKREAFVQIVVPRILRRLRRVLHAFGSLTPAAFEVMGFGADESSLEDDFGLESSALLESERFLRTLLGELGAAGIPYTLVGPDSAEFALQSGGWPILVSCVGMEQVLLQRFLRAAELGKVVSIGPVLPTRDQDFRALPEQILDPEAAKPVPFLLYADIGRLREMIERAVLELSLHTDRSQQDLELTLYRDGDGQARVLFAINCSSARAQAKVDARGCERAVDALDGEVFRATLGRFELAVPARSVRMFELFSQSPGNMP